MDHVLAKPKSIFKVATTQIEKRGDKGFKGRSRMDAYLSGFLYLFVHVCLNYKHSSALGNIFNIF